jgi:hypothetical protein
MRILAALNTFDEDMREMIRMFINSADFSPDAHFVVLLDIKHSVPHTENVHTMAYAKGILRGVEFVDALTSVATMPEDLAAAIAFYKVMKKSLSTTHDQLHPITDCFERQAAAQGPSRALCNQVAYCMSQTLGLEFCVRLVGLRGATHLNGRAGVIRAFDPTNWNRFLVRLDNDGKEVSVKADNVEYIRGDDYRRRAP